MDKIIYDLEYLSQFYPEAFKELAAMDPVEQRVMLTLLNGYTTSPPARGYADFELDKEDGTISALKVKWHVEITSQKRRGNQRCHLMTYEQTHEFLHDRQAMRKRVSGRVWAKRAEALDKALLKAVRWRGRDWLVQRIGEIAANDPVYEVDVKKEPKQ